jgi:hypothetical protein
MQRDRLVTGLHHLGLKDANYKVLKLLPLVYVAWSNGAIAPEQETRIVELAHRHFQIGEWGEKILRAWLQERPSPEYFHQGLHELLLLSQAPDEWGFDVDELPGLLAHAEAIARTSARAMDAPEVTSESEEQALRELAAELGIDNGESWAELLMDLQKQS